jgi:maleate isomerase
MRIGLMVPASNTTMERELLGCLPAGATCEVRRIRIGAGMITAESLPAYQDAAYSEARGFPRGLEAIAYGCTAAGFLGGPKADRDQAERIAAETGAPVVTAAAAMVAELRAVAAARVDVVSPYPESVNAGLVAFLAAEGIVANRIERLPAPDVAALCRLTPEDVAGAARRLIGSAGDAIFIACTQLPTAPVLAALNQACGKPVLSAVQVVAAQLLTRFSTAPI